MKLFLDDERIPSQVMLNDNEWTVIRKVWQMKVLLWISAKICTFVSHMSLDHDLGLNQPTGYALALWCAEKNIWPSEQVYVHSFNPVGRDNIKSVVDRYFGATHGNL